MGVVLYHAFDPRVIPNNLLRYPVQLLQQGSSFGYIGVFLFFVISGFCIHLQWAKTRAAGESTPIKFGAFWKRRLRRLYPPYIIALALFFSMTALSVGINFTHFFIYDVVMHLFMLHNLDPKTCYSINGVFWTLAIEEQLYLAYFLLLFIRTRLGWGWTLIICLLARVGWMTFSHVVWLKTGIGVPVPEAALSHWFTWALGAVGVEAYFGLIKLPRWTQDLRLSTVLIVIASALSHYLPWISKDTPLHNISWFLIHPLWGVGFFILVNRTVIAEKGWTKQLRLPTLISLFATLGVFSYSIYLTHELTIMQSWQYVLPKLSPLLNLFFLVLPATVFFAWVFFWFCEKPYMRKAVVKPKSPSHFIDEPSVVPALKPESV